MGSTYAYVNYNFLLAAMIVEKISGTTYESFLKTRFFRPLGMKDTGTHLPATDATRAAVGYHDDGSGALSPFADDPIFADRSLALVRLSSSRRISKTTATDGSSSARVALPTSGTTARSRPRGSRR